MNSISQNPQTNRLQPQSQGRSYRDAAGVFFYLHEAMAVFPPQNHESMQYISLKKTVLLERVSYNYENYLEGGKSKNEIEDSTK